MINMSKNTRTIPFNEAVKAVRSASRRIALLHLSYVEVIMEEFGEEKGLKLISKVIKKYGSRIGIKTREEVLAKGLEATPENFSKGGSYAIPKFGMHDRIEAVAVKGKKKTRAYGCVLAGVWQEYGKEKLGRLYCYMDVAKYMAYNPNYKLAHVKTVPDGEECCELEVRPTTEEEKKDFLAEDKDWFYIDK